MDLFALLGRLPYVGVFALAALGLYVLVASRNLIKRLAGLIILQAALALFYAGFAASTEGRAPTLNAREATTNMFANPMPHAQMIGALVVGAGAVLLGLALIVRVREGYGSIEEDEIDGADDEQDRAQRQAERGA